MHIPRLAKSAAFALAVLTASQITFAQTQPSTSGTGSSMPEKKMHHGLMCDQKVDWEAKRTERQNKLAQELNLTAEQKAEVDALEKAYYDAHKAEFDQQKTRHDEICKLKASGASEAEIHAKMQSMPKTDFAKMKADREKLDEQIRAILTPEQAKKFDAMKAERQQHWQMMKKRGAGKPGETAPSTSKP